MAKKTQKKAKKATRSDEKMGSPPPQRQKLPGKERAMKPRPVAVAFAKEGAHVAIVFRHEREDAEETQELIERQNRRCLLIQGDVGYSDFCRKAVARTADEFGRLDILVNNAAEQHVAEKLEDISDEQLERTFRTNIFGYFYMAREALPHLGSSGRIINTTSVTAYLGNPRLIDYSSTKGTIVAFTRSLAVALAERGVRVNGVAPGPIWTPLIPATFSEKDVSEFGGNTPLGRPGQPDEVAPCFVFLASDDSSYMTGQVLHPNGGKIVNG